MEPLEITGRVGDRLHPRDIRQETMTIATERETAAPPTEDYIQKQQTHSVCGDDIHKIEDISVDPLAASLLSLKPTDDPISAMVVTTHPMYPTQTPAKCLIGNDRNDGEYEPRISLVNQ